MKKLFLLITFFSLTLIFPHNVRAAAVSWDGGASTANWSDANNWSANALPTADDDVTINLSTTVNIATSTTINSLTLGQNGGGTTPTLNFSYNAIANGALILDAGNLIVYTGGTITHSEGTASVVGTVNIDIQLGTATIVGSINANYKGYQRNSGPGAGAVCNSGNGGDCGGPSYAGTGGRTSVAVNPGTTIYGSMTSPTDLGSGGNVKDTNQVNSGGGAIKLNVSGSLTNTGTISANGANGVGGSGLFGPSGATGGSIYITAGSLANTGTISANGGNGVSGSDSGGGGSGGRISINYSTSITIGTTTAYGGTTATPGGAGTIYIKQVGTNGNLIIDNNNQLATDDRNIGKTPLQTYTVDTLTLRNYGRASIESTTNVSYTTLDWSTKGMILDNSLSGVLSPLTDAGDLVVPATAYYTLNVNRTFNSLTVNGILNHSKNWRTMVYLLNFSVTNNLTIGSTGSINLDNLGFVGGYGNGAPSCPNGNCGGAGHGGTGGNGSGSGSTGGISYDVLEVPAIIGSGGGTKVGGEANGGGGAMQVLVGGTLTVNGTISALGGNGYDGSGEWCHGAGSGGSISMIASNFAGNSTISVAGGNGVGNCSGGGSGGRIAMYYSSSNSYIGTISVAGGTGYRAGQTGTKLLKASSGELVSTPFNTGDPATLLYDLIWTENLTTGTDVKLQLSTAPDNGSGAPGTWTDWYGPSGAGTYYTDPSGGESIYSAHSDAGSDQWFKYKIIFSAATNDVNIPTISDISLTYIINTAPTVTITNTPSQSSSGTVAVSYTVSDPEESTVNSYLAADLGLTTSSDYVAGSTASLTLSSASSLPSTGTILIDNEMISYTGKSGSALTGITRGANTTTNTTHTSGSSVWFVAPSSSMSGDYGSMSVSGTKNIVWTPSSDLSNLETTTAKIKILANDGNLANQVGSDFESAITLDTKAPIVNDLYLNKYLGQITLTSTDGNGIYYKASNNADLSADGVNATSGIWTAYTTPINWTFASDPSTVYVRYKDAYGNETSTVSTITPTRLSSLMIQDASNPDTAEWRLFVSWIVATSPSQGFNYYQIYRSTDGVSYTPRLQINNQSENYFIDTGLTSTTTYYYKTTVVDDHGNESDANYPIQTSGSSSRSGVGLTPDGSGGGDFTAPNITSIVVDNITTTSVTFTWTTDELSDSTVGYSTNTSYANEVGSISMGTSHSVTLSNLTPNTSYYYRAISADALNNKSTVEDSSTQSFSTLADTTGPVISNIKAVVGETQAGVSWSTTEESTSRVEYSIDDNYSEATTSASLDFGHALTLTGLTIDTTYNYRVISVDANDNSSTSPSYTFTTSAITVADLDTTPPSISSISISDTTSSSVKIAWNTSEGADGKVEYGESTSYERGIAEGNHEYKTSKSVTVIGLSPETTYHYRITVVDAAGNVGISGDATFATSAQATVDLLTSAGTSSGSNAPVITTAGASVSDITGTTATLSWTTTKKSTSEVYYKVKNSLDAPINTGSTSYLTDHVVTLVGLSPATAYEYQVKSTDVNGNFVSSSKAEFTTTLPGVTAVKVVSKSAIEASVSWLTTIPTTTVVEYINTTTKETRKYSNSSLVTSHVADLVGLYPGTIYSFTVLIADEAGNLARSDQYSFSTGEDTVGPSITGVNNRSTIIAGQNKVQTVVTWTTNEPTTSLVEYSLGTGTGNYDQKTRENEDFVQNHIMVISGLKPGSVYRYRVNSKDRAGNEGQSEAYVLLTPLKEVSALDLIIENLQSSFGWLNKL